MEGPGPDNAPAGTPPVGDIFELAQLVFGGDHGQNCYVFVPVNVTHVSSLTLSYLKSVSALDEVNPPCPASVPKPKAPTVSPQELAEEFWDTIPLPVPAPKVPPGYAITGKRAYLLTGDTMAPTAWTKATPLGELRVTATGSYSVDWGAGTSPETTGPYRSTGAPYPNGTITHTYDDTGTYTITVREAWTAEWQLGAAHGTLAQLHTTGTIPGFVVRQIQAVITG